MKLLLSDIIKILFFAVSVVTYMFISDIVGVLLLLGCMIFLFTSGTDFSDDEIELDVIDEVEEQTGVVFDKISKVGNVSMAAVKEEDDEIVLLISDKFLEYPYEFQKFVLFHEAGHIKYNDSKTTDTMFKLYGSLLLLTLLFNRYILLCIIFIVGLLLMFYVFRRAEYRADEYSASLVDTEIALISLDCFKSVKEDKFTRIKRYFRTHPYKEDRIEHIENKFR